MSTKHNSSPLDKENNKIMDKTILITEWQNNYLFIFMQIQCIQFQSKSKEPEKASCIFKEIYAN